VYAIKPKKKVWVLVGVGEKIKQNGECVLIGKPKQKRFIIIIILAHLHLENPKRGSKCLLEWRKNK